MRVLLLGGSRFVGRGIAEGLLEEGHDLALFNRGSNASENPAGVEQITGDREDAAALGSAAARGFDVVVDTSGYAGRHVAAACAAFAGKTARYVFLSTGAVYAEGEHFPLREDSPIGPMPLWGSYGEEKLAGERAVERAAASGGFRYTHLRATYVLGNGNYADRENFLFARIDAGEPILLPDGGNAIVQFLDAVDLGRLTAAAVADPAAPDAVINLASPEAITLRGLVAAAAELLGKTAQIVPFSMQAEGVPDRPYHLKDAPFPFANEHFLLDTRRQEELLPGYRLRAPVEMLAAWLDANRDTLEIRRSPTEERLLARLAPASPLAP